MSSFETFVQAELPNRQVLLVDSGNPGAGAGNYAPIGAYWLDQNDSYKRYVKYGENDTDWEVVPTASDIGSGGGGGATLTSEISGNWESTYNTVQSISAIHTQVFTRGSLSVDMASPSATFIAMQESNFAADGYWQEVNSKHVMVLPYDTYVKKIMFRSTGSGGETVNIGVHSNRDVTNITSEEYKYFDPTPIETQTYTFANNNQSRGYVFTTAASATAGDTLGVSVSATGDVGLASLTIVLDFIKD